MIVKVGDIGYLRVDNEEDRKAIAVILFKNGYTVSTVRQKRNGKSFEYYVKYELKERDVPDEDGQ